MHWRFIVGYQYTDKRYYNNLQNCCTTKGFNFFKSKVTLTVHTPNLVVGQSLAVQYEQEPRTAQL